MNEQRIAACSRCSKLEVESQDRERVLKDISKLIAEWGDKEEMDPAGYLDRIAKALTAPF